MSGCSEVEIDPDARDRMSDVTREQETIQLRRLRTFIKNFLPGVDALGPDIVDPCIFTVNIILLACDWLNLPQDYFLLTRKAIQPPIRQKIFK